MNGKRKMKTFVLICHRDGDISTLTDTGIWQMDEHYSVDMKRLAWLLMATHECVGEL